MLKSVMNGILKDVPLDHTQVSTLKMLLFDSVPKSCRNSFDNSRLSCLKRGTEYKLFEEAILKFEEEIDIVKLIRD